MKKYLLIFITCLGANAATLQFYMTNSLGQPDTNWFQVIPVGNTILANGGFNTKGIAIKCFPNTNGFFQTNLNLGNYLVTNKFLGTGSLISVPDSPLTFNAAQPGVAISGFNTYNYSPGVQRLTSSDGSVTMAPANGMGTVDLKSSIVGIIPFSVLPPNIVTNAQSGVMFSSSLNTFAITNPALGIAIPMGAGNSAYGSVLRIGGSSLLGIQAGPILANNFYGDGSGLTLGSQPLTGTMGLNNPAVYVDSTNGNDAWSGTDILHPVQTIAKANTIAGTNWTWFLFPGRTYDLGTNGPWLVQEGSKIYAWGATITTTNGVANVTGQTILYASGSFAMYGGTFIGAAPMGTFQFPIYLAPTNSALPPMQVVLDGVSITNYSDGIYSLLGGGTANRTVKMYVRNCSIFTGFDCININQAAQPANCEFWIQGSRFGALAVTNQSTIVRGIIAGPGSWYIDGCDIKAMGGTGTGADIGILLANRAQVVLAGTSITIDTTNKPTTCLKVQSDVHGELAAILGHPYADSEVAGTVQWTGDTTNAFLNGGFISSDSSGNRFWSLNGISLTNLNFSSLLAATNTWAGDNITSGNWTNNGTWKFNGLLSSTYFTTTTFTNNLGQFGLWGPSAYDGSTLTNLKAGNTMSVVSGGSIAATKNPNGSTNFALTITGGGGNGYDVVLNTSISNAVTETPIYTNALALASTNGINFETTVRMDGPTNHFHQHWDSDWYAGQFYYSNKISSNASSFSMTSRWATNGSAPPMLVLYVKGPTNESVNLTAKSFVTMQTNTLASVVGGGGGTNFTAAWSMNEASGNRIDCKSSLALVPNGTVTQVAGQVGNAVHFGGAATDYLTMADNPAISTTGNVSFSVTFWFKSDTATVGANTFTPIAHLGAAGSYGWQVYFTSANVVLGYSSDGTSGNYHEITKAFSMDTAWHFVAIAYNGASIGISVDNSAYTTSVYSAGVFDPAVAFTVGNTANPTSATAFPGAVDEVVFYKWALGTSDISTRWNGGAGRAECSFP